MAKLIEEIIKFNPRYKNLRLSSVKYMPKTKVCNVFYLYPKTEDYNQEVQNEIEKLTRQILDIDVILYCHFAKVSVLESFVKPVVSAIVKSKINTELPASNITLTQGDINHVEVVISSLFYDFAQTQGLDKIISQELNDKFCAEFTTVIKSDGKEVELAEFDPKSLGVPVKPNYDGMRVIIPTQVEKLVGPVIEDAAVYIKDISNHSQAVICGEIYNWQKLTYKGKDKTGEIEIDKVYYKFMLTDFTGSIECVFFATRFTPKSVEEMPDGQTVVMRGVVKPPRFKQGAISFTVRHISFCEIPQDLEEVIYKNPVPENYNLVHPIKVQEKVQSSMFGAEKLPQEMLDKKFVVFDVETTGLSMSSDKITEIGAVKIVNGVITEHFTTLINPKRKIPLENTLITGINDDMVKNAPTFEDIVGDFYKFCDGAALVAHNAQFDVGFLKTYSDATHYYFEHEVIDTLQLSQRKLPRLGSHKLGSLAKYFGFVNESAHRAMFDAEVTAKVFLELHKIA